MLLKSEFLSCQNKDVFQSEKREKRTEDVSAGLLQM